MKKITYQFNYAVLVGEDSVVHSLNKETQKPACGKDGKFIQHALWETTDLVGDYVLCNKCFLVPESTASFRGEIVTFYEDGEEAMKEFKDES